MSSHLDHGLFFLVQQVLVLDIELFNFFDLACTLALQSLLLYTFDVSVDRVHLLLQLETLALDLRLYRLVVVRLVLTFLFFVIGSGGFLLRWRWLGLRGSRKHFTHFGNPVFFEARSRL